MESKNQIEGSGFVLPQKWPPWVALLILVSLIFLVYWPAIHGGFIWDDDDYVTNNPLLIEPDGLYRIWATRESVQYYPLVFTTFLIEMRLWGLQPMGYHIVNVAFHAINALVFWLLLRRLGVKGALFAAAIFALHPVYVESVAWITERKNVLSGMFYLLAAGSYLRFEDCRRWFWYFVALVLFLLALFSKTVTCSLPVVLFLILWWRRGKVDWRDIRLLLPFVVVGLVMGLLTAWYEVHYVGAQGEEWDISFGQRLLIAGRALWFYAIKLVWPVNLTFIYPRWELDVFDLWQWVWPLSFVIAAFCLWWFRERVGRGPLVGLACFSVTLFPALGFFDIYPMRYSYVADHFQYLASMGLIALSVGSVAYGIEQWGLTPARGMSKGFGLTVLGLIVLLVLGVLTWRQAHVYKNLETLWRDTIDKNPQAWMAYNNLGLVLSERGDNKMRPSCSTRRF